MKEKKGRRYGKIKMYGWFLRGSNGRRGDINFLCAPLRKRAKGAYNSRVPSPQPTMTKVQRAAIALRSHGIYCRRDWGSAGRWLAEAENTMYCVGGLDILAAVEAEDPIAYLDSVC